MSELSIQELEKTAEAYEELLVPALFGECARHLADAAEIQAGHKVLDVACGTGVLARAIVQHRDIPIFVSGLDLNPGMLAVAREKAPNIDWQEGNAESLPFSDETFDVVASQFGLMLFASPKVALQEMNRVLRHGGHLMLAVFDSLDNLPAYKAMAEVFERVVGPSVGEALRIPFSMGDTKQLTSLVSAAGISNPVITTREGTARFSSPRQMVLSDVKGWFPFAQIHLDDHTIEAVVSEAEKVLKPFRAADHAVEFRVPVHVLTATKP